MLHIKGTFLDSKVARQMFILFVISALLPVFILAFFSIRQINSLTTHNIERDLRQDAKSYGLSVYDRLLLLDEKLAVHAASLKESSSEKPGRNIFYGFTNLNIFDATDNSYKTDHYLPPISETERTLLLEGNSILVTKQQPNLAAKIYLLRAIKGTNQIVTALIDGEALWGKTETFDASKGFCVYGAKDELLFCSQLNLDSQLKTIKSKLGEATTGNLKLSEGKHNLFVGYWSLFIKPKFKYPSFTIVITFDENIALEPISSLRNIFITVSILTLVIVAFLSTIQIRRYLTPLEELMRGIQRIYNNDFKHPVVVTTDDEFRQLADSFNSMSTRISQQFEFLTTMSDIDQLILSNGTIKDIIATIISQANQTTQSDTMNVAMLDEQNDELLEIYSEDIHHIHGVSMTPHSIQRGSIDDLINKKVAIYAITDTKIPNYLKPLTPEDLSCFALVPIQFNDKLKAILIFGFRNSVITQGIHFRLRELGDRFAIALEKSAREKLLYHQAHYDPLTLLPNRQLLNDRLQHTIKRAARDHSCFSLLYLDLDRFKIVNDSLGHSVGDKLLKMVSQRLIETLREDDTVARLGGDEFVIFLTTINDQDEIFSHVTPIAEKILSAVTQPYSIGNQEIHISTSIGISSFPTDGHDMETLIKNADAAMYHAKSEGRNNFQFYSNKLGARAMQNLVMETKLHQALKNNEFELYYQPKVDAITHKILGAEALIRWVHPTEGLIFPDQFIPLAEETGLIKQMGAWTIHEACRQNKHWQIEGLPKIKMSVNLSPKQFQQQDLITIVENALDAAQLESVYLDLEIVESAAMHDIEQTITTLKQLKWLGLSISLDDYGTGYSTLFYIKQFSVDCLKIDRSFICNLMSDSGDKAIVSSTITLAHELGLTVVAEGVENEQQLAWLQDKGCDEIQGYYFSRPLPASEFKELLKTNAEAYA